MSKLGIRLNLLNTGLSQVSGMELDSVCKTSSGYAVAGAEGLGTLGGLTDNTRDVDWKFVSPKNNFGIQHNKRIRRVYLTGTATGNVKVTCENSEDKSFNVTSANLKSKYSATADIPGKRNYVGTHWQLIVESVGNCKAFIEYAGILFVVLTRKRGL